MVQDSGNYVLSHSIALLAILVTESHGKQQGRTHGVWRGLGPGRMVSSGESLWKTMVSGDLVSSLTSVFTSQMNACLNYITQLRAYGTLQHRYENLHAPYYHLLTYNPVIANLSELLITKSSQWQMCHRFATSDITLFCPFCHILCLRPLNFVSNLDLKIICSISLQKNHKKIKRQHLFHFSFLSVLIL